MEISLRSQHDVDKLIAALPRDSVNMIRVMPSVMSEGPKIVKIWDDVLRLSFDSPAAADDFIDNIFDLNPGLGVSFQVTSSSNTVVVTLCAIEKIGGDK